MWDGSCRLPVLSLDMHSSLRDYVEFLYIFLSVGSSSKGWTMPGASSRQSSWRGHLINLV